jgi:hypothetical protein
MAKGDDNKGAVSAPASLDTVELFNSTSAPIGIMVESTVITLPPFSVVGTPVSREVFSVWSKTVVGQAYLDKGLVCTKKSDAIGYSPTSELIVPPELQAPASAGASESEVVQKPTLDGGVTLPVG